VGAGVSGAIRVHRLPLPELMERRTGMTVPHFFQSSPQSCGPACVRMLFAALGLSFDEGTIAQACKMIARGCQLQDLVDGSHALGLNAELLRIRDEPGAVAALSNRVPFVAMIDLASLDSTQPLLSWHFVVPLGIAGDEVTYHDPADGPDRRVKLDDFLGAWATAGYGGMRVWTP
jgi:ABC-type bacteriocin/lantibiotic exporter with double-glycine peptidase domain